MPRSEPGADDPQPQSVSDLKRILEQHVETGFPPDLALDLVLNELVVRAADATGASAAALALMRGDEMVCRASTGLHAPDLGIPINIRDGLSGACVRTHKAQISNDAESDSRVEGAASRRLGIRSMLIVPVLEESPDAGAQPKLAGVLEVFSPLAHAFDERSQTLLEEFARECVLIRQAADGLTARPPAPEILLPDAEPATPRTATAPPDSALLHLEPLQARQPYEAWTLVLAALVILAAISLSFLIGSRIGWLPSQSKSSSASAPAEVSAKPAPVGSNSQSASATRTKTAAKGFKPGNESNRSDATRSTTDELVVYDKGKVVFRMGPMPASKTANPHEDASNEPAASNAASDRSTAQVGSSIIPASSSAKMPSERAVWLAPTQAESRLVSRVEPQYPPDALSARRSGEVLLEVHVGLDGTVSSVRALTGDPVLADAASQAVRSWRYQPYVVRGRPAEFQTDVTLKFALPE